MDYSWRIFANGKTMTLEKKRVEMTPVPDLRKAKRTGPDRMERPVYLDRLPPCNEACPAGENIQAWLRHVQEGKFKQAWEEIMRNNPLSAVLTCSACTLRRSVA